MSRESIQASAYNKVVNAINNYGYNVPIYRDIYEEDELGCKVLQEPNVYIDDIVCIIDNSGGRTKSTVNTNRGIVKEVSYATLYTPYQENIPLQIDDIVLYENCFYKVTHILDLVHYHILLQASLERVDLDGR